MSRYHRRNIFRTSNAMYKELLKKEVLTKYDIMKLPGFRNLGRTNYLILRISPTYGRQETDTIN